VWANIGKGTVTVLALLLVWAILIAIEAIIGDQGSLSLYRAIVHIEISGLISALIWLRD
jgi:hypothetical protein